MSALKVPAAHLTGVVVASGWADPAGCNGPQLGERLVVARPARRLAGDSSPAIATRQAREAVVGSGSCLARIVRASAAILGRDGSERGVDPHRADRAVGLRQRPYCAQHTSCRTRHWQGGGGGLGAVGALRAGQAKGSRVSVGEIVVGGWRAGGYDGAVSEQ